MPNEIVLALITSLSSVLGAGLGVIASNRLTNYRLEQLEKKVDKLSDSDRRISLLEQRVYGYEEK